MPFYNGDQEISDKEMVKAYRERLANRKAWCDEHAKAFFATKQTKKRYKTEYYVPDVDRTEWLTFYDGEIDEYMEFMRKERQDYLEQNPTEADNEDLWNEWMRDAYADANFTIEDLDPNTAELKWIDLDHPRSTYLFMVHCFPYDPEEKPDCRKIWVDLSDEQYIRLLSEYLYDSYSATVGSLYFRHPDIYKAIAEQCFWKGSDCAVLLEEVKHDAEVILKEFGESQPGLPEGPFAAMIAWLASKPEFQEE
jgi:hypothetical protein